MSLGIFYDTSSYSDHMWYGRQRLLDFDIKFSRSQYNDRGIKESRNFVTPSRENLFLLFIIIPINREND